MDSNEGSGSEIVLETRPEPKGKYPPLTIEDTNGDYRHAAWTSLGNGILFVLFTDMSNMRLRLVAVKDTGREFEKLYDMDLPESIDIAIDEFSQTGGPFCIFMIPGSGPLFWATIHRKFDSNPQL